MAKDVTITIPTEFVACVDAYRNAQLTPTVDPDTGAVSMTAKYPTTEDLIEAIVADKIAEYARMYPTNTMRLKLQQAATAQAEAAAQARPSSLKKVNGGQ